MIINARINNSPLALSKHLQSSENEIVEIFDGGGLWLSPSKTGDLQASIAAIKDIAFDIAKPKYTGCYHIDINPTSSEIALLRTKYGEAWQSALINKTLSHFGLKGHPHLFVQHVKRGQVASLKNEEGRTHFHVIVGTFNPETRRQINLFKDRYRWQKVSAQLEEELGSQPTNRQCRAWDDKERSYIEKQIEDRTASDFTAQKRIIQEAWHQSENGNQFAHRLASSGLLLTYNHEKSRFVVIDSQNNPKALGQYLKGKATAKTLNSKLADIIGKVPNIETVIEKKISPKLLSHLINDCQFSLSTNGIKPPFQMPQRQTQQIRKRKTVFLKKLLQSGFKKRDIGPLNLDDLNRVNICNQLGKMFLHLRSGSMICNTVDRLELFGLLSAQAISMMVDISELNGWKALEIWGDRSFKIMMTKECLKRGIAVTNFALSLSHLESFIKEFSNSEEIAKILATHSNMDEKAVLDFVNSYPENTVKELHKIKESGIPLQTYINKNCEAYQCEKIRHFVSTGEIDADLTDSTKTILHNALSNVNDMDFLKAQLSSNHKSNGSEMKGVISLSQRQKARQEKLNNQTNNPSYDIPPSYAPKYIPSRPFP